jgi:hypothetical protein
MGGRDLAEDADKWQVVVNAIVYALTGVSLNVHVLWDVALCCFGKKFSTFLSIVMHLSLPPPPPRHNVASRKT